MDTPFFDTTFLSTQPKRRNKSRSFWIIYCHRTFFHLSFNFISEEEEMATPSQVSSCKCEKCGNEMYNEKNLIHHLNFCGITQPNNICKLCDNAFHSSDEFLTHLLTCGHFICRYCNIPFIHTKAFHYHIQSSHRTKQNIGRNSHGYKCSICKEICASRRELYYYGNTQQGGNDTRNDIPPDILHNDNIELRRVYIANRDHILAPDEEGEMRKIYNFQTNNVHGGYREIRGHVQQIFNDQDNSFRINLGFGMIQVLYSTF